MLKQILALFAILGLALGMAACTTEPHAENWKVTNVSFKDTVENIPCNEIDSAHRQIHAAVDAALKFDEGDADLLGTLGLWKDNSLDEVTWNGNPQAPESSPQHAGVQKRLEDRVAGCPEGADSDEEPATSATTTKSPEQARSDLLASCERDGKFTVHLDPNKDGDLKTGGLSEIPEEMKEELLTLIGCEPRVLLAYYNASPLGKITPIKELSQIAPLEEGASYTDEGKELYSELHTLIKTLTKIEKAELPKHGVNTGAMPGGQVFQAEGEIPAGKAVSIQYLDVNGKVIHSHDVRVDCGNPLGRIPGIGGPPPGAPQIVKPPPPGRGGPPPVTQPPGQPPVTQPPGTTQPPPPPVCPPGMTGTPPVCKDTEAAGPARVVPPQQQPNPLPLRPDHAQPTRPASPAPVYVPPAPAPPVAVPPNQGGPVPIETPRYTPPPETGAPAPSAPETACIPAPGMASC